MKFAVAVPLIFAAPAHASEASPIAKVMQMLSNLQSKVIGEGEQAQRVYQEFSEWCEEQSKQLSYEIKGGTSQINELKATIEFESSQIEALTAKVGELSSEIATDEADLKAAREIRDKEAGVFAASEKDLTGIIDTLQRAIGILERDQAKKGAAAMLQFKSAANIVQALGVMVQASVLNSADADRLTALVQSSEESADDDVGAPAGATYKGQSGGIIETMEGLLEKAQDQLNSARKAETADIHNFEMLEESLEGQLKSGNADLAAAKKSSASSAERKAAAEGDLAATTKELNGDNSNLADVHHECMTKAQDFEAEVKSRNEELTALADAKKVIGETTGGSDALSYGLNQVSLIELASSTDLAHFEAVRFVRDLARKEKSSALALLAQRMASAMRSSSGAGNDPFEKVKGLIRDMLSKLEEEANRDAQHESYCDKEIAESNVKNEDKTAEISKLSSSIDQMSARSAQLKEEVAALMKGLADLAASQADMQKIRNEEHTIFLRSKADMEKGLEGIKLALKILTDYYAQGDKAHAAADGAGGGIIGLLEVVESDFSKGLAETIATEDSAQAAYDAQSKMNEIDKANKDQDVKYKSKEAKDLDKAAAEDTSDRATVQTELDAVSEYLTRLHKQCDEKTEPYEETKRRREAELAGLKQALEILSGEAVLLQRQVTSSLRGIHIHARA